MIRTIVRIEDSLGIIIDDAVLQHSHLKAGDEVNVEVHPGGTITITPLDPEKISPAAASEAAKRIIGKNSELFRRLS